MLEHIIKLLTYIISSTVGMMIVFNFMNKMYRPQYLGKNLKIIIYCIATIIWFFINFIGIPILNFTYFITITLIIGFFLYKVRNIREILQIITFIVSYAGCDSIVSSLLSIISGSIPLYSKNTILLLFNVIVVQTFMIAICKLLIFIFKKQKITYKYTKKYVFLTILPILNIVIICIIFILPTYRVDQTVTNFIIMLMSVISGILNLAVIYFFESISKSDQLENDLILIQQRMNMQYNYYQQLEVEYDNSQKIMHDIKNHIKVLERLYNTGQHAEGLEYAKKISEIVEVLGMKFKSDSRILNIIVNEKIKICEMNEIEFVFSVENLDLSFIDDIDITAIFANLLDNAIEACKNITNGVKRIELRVYQFNNMLITNLINSVDSIPMKDEQEEFISNKKNHKAIGLSNVRTSVCKYDGDMNVEVEQGKFSVSIMFPIRNKKIL